MDTQTRRDDHLLDAALEQLHLATHLDFDVVDRHIAIRNHPGAVYELDAMLRLKGHADTLPYAVNIKRHLTLALLGHNCLIGTKQ